MRPLMRASLLVVLLLPLAIGCTSMKPHPEADRPSGSVPTSPQDYIDVNGDFTSPLDRQLPPLDPARLRAAFQRQTDEIDAQVQACMKEQGYTAPPGPKLPPDEPAVPVKGYGIADRYEDELLFFARSATTTTSVPASTPLSPEAQVALTGLDGKGGCVATARADHPAVSPTPTIDAMQPDFAKLDADIAADPRSVAFAPAWTACMKIRGYDVADRGFVPQIVEDHFERVVADNIVAIDEQAAFDDAATYETNIAAADELCYRESGGESARRQVIVDHQLRFIESHREQIGQARSEIDRFNSSS